MFELELWKLRQQLDRINQTTQRTEELLDATEIENRKEREKIEREHEASRRLFEPPATASPASPAPASPHALFKARTLAGLRGTAAPPAPTVPPNPVFAQIKQETLAGLRGDR
jgi:hypothetical protein